MSGEPLSEELEAKITSTLNVIVKAAVCAHDGAGHGHEYERNALLPILRAFAREIQCHDPYTSSHQPQHCEKTIDHHRAALLASQESCRSLSEALDWYARGIVSVQSEAHVIGEHRLGKGRDPECPMCDDGRKAREAVAAYRSSEAGRGTS